jgi:cellulose synthase/poly-beta-1,6-N-acetylglucosamine synthase-like glycosyltransferase
LGLANWFILILTIVFIVYFVYAIPIVVVGIFQYKKKGFGDAPGDDWDPPNVSILVPAKNEEKVIGRLLQSLVNIDYPRENLEVIVVEDQSKDRTLEICQQYANQYSWIKVYHRDSSLGKGDALNYGFSKSNGEIIATFDADDVPEPQAIKKALRYFERPTTGAVHGYHRTLNLRETVISRLASYETFLYRISNMGKNALRLFIVFSGSNTFFRRTALEKAGLWDAESLVEDAELSVRFAKAGIETRLVPVECWQEMPAKISSFFRQRVRWSTGNLQTGFKHWNAGRRMGYLRAFDMEMLMMSPILAVLALAAWTIIALGFVKVGLPFASLMPLLLVVAALNTAYLGIIALSILSQVKTGILSYFLLMLATYPYGLLISAANLVSMVLLFKPHAHLWLKTDKTGYIDEAIQSPSIGGLMVVPTNGRLNNPRT